MSNCSICLDGISCIIPIKCPCAEVDPHDPVCKDCMSGYINLKIGEAFMGSCPVISCPGIHASKAAAVLNYLEWSDVACGIVKEENIKKYEDLAKSLLTFLCGGCHKMNSLFVPSVSNSKERIDTLDDLCSGSKFTGDSREGLESCLDSFGDGSITASECFMILTNAMFSTTTLGDKDSWAIFEKILKLVENPERRANLHLRYIRARPRVWTRCCSREHCFRCRTKDFHEGKVCEEMIESHDNNMLECPACGIFLVKGDGCNSVTCVCGSQFSWSDELKVSTASRAFLGIHPDNPSRACADMLCEPDHSAETVSNAAAWRARHKVETDRELIRWWERKFGPVGATQACALRKGISLGTITTRGMPFHIHTQLVTSITKRESCNTVVCSLTAGAESAGALFQANHNNEVTRASAQIEASVASLFTSMFPCAADRGKAAIKLLHHRYAWSNVTKESTSSASTSSTARGNNKPDEDVRLLASAYMWVNSHTKEYNEAVEDYESRMARCFLCLYGSKMVPTPKFDESDGTDTPTHSHCYIPNATSWNRAVSNASLEFDDPTTVKRPGGASCYPAAFATVPADVSYFAVRILECNHTQNTLSFGLARRSFPKESSDGVGRTSNSWGLHDERGSTGETAKASSCGTRVASCPRKFAQGDILKCMVDLPRGVCVITLNDAEFEHTFSLPAGGKADEYYFAMTFANDHKVSLIDCFDNTHSCDAASAGVASNVEHTEMFRALVTRLRRIILSDPAIDLLRVRDLADRYVEQRGLSKEDCAREILLLRPLISWVTKTKSPSDVKAFKGKVNEGTVSSKAKASTTPTSPSGRKEKIKVKAAAKEVESNNDFKDKAWTDGKMTAFDVYAALFSKAETTRVTWQELTYAVGFMMVYKQEMRDAKSTAKLAAKKEKSKEKRSSTPSSESINGKKGAKESSTTAVPENNTRRSRRAAKDPQLASISLMAGTASSKGKQNPAAPPVPATAAVSSQSTSNASPRPPPAPTSRSRPSSANTASSAGTSSSTTSRRSTPRPTPTSSPAPSSSVGSPIRREHVLSPSVYALSTPVEEQSSAILTISGSAVGTPVSPSERRGSRRSSSASASPVPSVSASSASLASRPAWKF